MYASGLTPSANSADLAKEGVAPVEPGMEDQKKVGAKLKEILKGAPGLDAFKQL